MFKELLKFWRSGNLLDESKQITQEMFTKSAQAVGDSLDLLINNKEFTVDVYQTDMLINHLEKDVRKKILEHLTINPRQDVAAALVLLGVVRDIERIGDFAKNFFELNKVYQKKITGKYGERLIIGKEQIMKMMAVTQQALVQGSKEQAEEVMNWYYQQISPEMTAVLDEVMVDGDLKSKDAVAYALLARYLKRVSAHLANIASSVFNPFHRIGFGIKENRDLS